MDRASALDPQMHEKVILDILQQLVIFSVCNKGVGIVALSCRIDVYV